MFTLDTFLLNTVSVISFLMVHLLPILSNHLRKMITILDNIP